MPRARNKQPTASASGQPYGQRQALEQAQQAMPLPNNAPVLPDAQRAERTMESARQFQAPQLGFGAPTARPNEPVTAGMGDPLMGPAFAGVQLTPVDKLKAIYAKTRNPDLMDLIVLLEQRGRR